MYMLLTFTDDKASRTVQFSELVNKDEMFVSGYGGGNSVNVVLKERQIRELRKWLTLQIKKLPKQPKK